LAARAEHRVICALTVLALASPAFATDLDLDSLGYSHTVTISSPGSLTSNDFGTLRARAD
jgi:hypothetical protein